MPKISDAQRDARRTHFIEAARRCFSRYGIAGTRMEDIRAEAGLSAGSMYLYFTTKDDLVRAAVGSSLADFEALTQQAISSPASLSPGTFVTEALAQAEAMSDRADGVDLFRLAVQGWAHAQTDASTARLISESYRRILGMYEDAATVWVGAQDARAVAETIASQILGFVAQRALVGTPTAAWQARGLRLIVDSPGS